MKKLMNTLEVFAKAMVQPLMYLSVAGMILAIGSVLTNSSVTAFLPFLQWGPIQVIGKLMYECMMILINNLGLLFVIGIPAALAKREKHQAGLIGFMSYLIYLKTSNVMLTQMGKLAEPSAMLGLFGTGQAEILGIQVVDMSVFGGILLGCLVGWVFNKTYEKKFNGAFQIYSGVRFSFACMVAVSIAFGVVSNIVWPVVQQGISALANFIKSTDLFGLFVYGFLERLLIPTGLHHLVYTPFQFTDLGGVLQLGDTIVAGAYPIVMTELQMGGEFSDSIYYMAIGFTKMFGYIGIGAAFIHTAHPHNRKRTIATIVPLVVTACLASITEPLDFMFIFVAPVLYILHACIAGLFIVLLKVCGVTAFCGGNMLASILMNLSAGVERTKWPIMLLLGVIQILVYFFLFSFVIKKLNYKTPGREDDLEETAKDKTPSKTFNGSEDAKFVVEGLGGKDNINTVENCFTRLRVNVKDAALVNDELINKTPNSGIIKKGNDIQVVFGLQVADVRKSVEDYLQSL